MIELYQLYDLLYEKHGKNALLFKNHINCFDKKISILNSGFIVMSYQNKQNFFFSTKEDLIVYFETLNI